MNLRAWISRTRLVIVLLSLLLGGGLACWVQGLWQARPWWGPFMPQVHLPNARPGVIAVHVRDAQGRPVFGAEVWITDTSASSFQRTGLDGSAEFHLHEDEIVEIDVDELAIVRRNLFKILHASKGADVFYIQSARPTATAGDVRRRALREGLGLPWW